MNLASLFLAPAVATPDHIALIDHQENLTYRALARRAGGVAQQLREAGISRGDRVALLGNNSIDFAAAYVGTLWIGAIAVPLNAMAAPAELAAQLAAVTPSGVVILPGFTDALPDGAQHLSINTRREAENVPLEVVEGHEVAVLLFTSGTAGHPKAAMLTHANLAANIAAVQGSEALAMQRDDVGFAALPWFHVFGLNVGLGLGLASGVPTVVADAFDPAGALELIAEKQVTIVAVVPTMLRNWLELPRATTAMFTSVRMCVSGAATLEPALAEQVYERFGVTVHDGYGLTEAAPIVATSALDARRDGSVGKPIPGVQVRLIDSDGFDSEPGDAGEIWVKGPSVFPGYWNDPHASAAVLNDGWLQTGDIATQDDDGYLYLVDRAKDLIIVSGFNVFPAEVETVLLEQESVTDAAVIGVPDDRTGEAVKAYVVLESPVSLDTLNLWCRSRLSRYKCPREIEIVEGIPRSVNGKVLRRVLRDPKE